MKLRHCFVRVLFPISCTALSLLCFAYQTPANRSGARNTAASGPQTADTKLAWRQFEDPNEHAFTVDVPQGWTVSGGLFRLGYSDERPMVDMRSPDGEINIRLGDLAVPTYTVPVQFHEREGEIYDLGAQAQMVVARYRTGPEFAVLYSHARVNTSCRNPQPDTSIPEFSLPDYLPTDTNASQSSSGQIAYRCDTAAGPRIAFVYAKTVLDRAIWQVPGLVSLIAPPDKVNLALNILKHCAQSLKIHPQWIEYQKNLDAEGLEYQRQRQAGRMQQLQAQVQQFEAKMRAMQNQVRDFESHQAAFANQTQGFLNVLNGVTPTTDPLTGEHRDVWTGQAQNYWVNGVGQVVNSNSNPAPNQNWHQLQVAPN